MGDFVEPKAKSIVNVPLGTVPLKRYGDCTSKTLQECYHTQSCYKKPCYLDVSDDPKNPIILLSSRVFLDVCDNVSALIDNVLKHSLHILSIR